MADKSSPPLFRIGTHRPRQGNRQNIPIFRHQRSPHAGSVRERRLPNAAQKVHRKPAVSSWPFRLLGADDPVSQLCSEGIGNCPAYPLLQESHHGRYERQSETGHR